MLNSIFDSTTGSITFLSLMISLVVSIILGVIIAITHKYTSRYSKNFLITVALLPTIVAAIIIMVNGNLGTSIAIMGAFSLVRFRSLPGTSREILIVFFPMAVGLATGMGQIWFAILLTVIGCIMIALLNNVKLFDARREEKTLKILIPEHLDYEGVFDDIFKEYTSEVSHLKTKITNMGSLFELTYKVMLKSGISEKKLIDELRTRNSNLKIILSRDLDVTDL